MLHILRLLPSTHVFVFFIEFEEAGLWKWWYKTAPFMVVPAYPLITQIADLYSKIYPQPQQVRLRRA
jgi:hypothetical protein